VTPHRSAAGNGVRIVGLSLPPLETGNVSTKRNVGVSFTCMAVPLVH